MTPLDVLPVIVKCNLHPWMNAWIHVFDHPYFAVTDADGKFEIKNAPAGKYRLLAWKDGAGWLNGDRKGREIIVKSNGTVEVSLTAKPDEP